MYLEIICLLFFATVRVWTRSQQSGSLGHANMNLPSCFFDGLMTNNVKLGFSHPEERSALLLLQTVNASEFELASGQMMLVHHSHKEIKFSVVTFVLFCCLN